MSIEREIMFTGIGGQGVQLAAQVLARAAVKEEREVMLFGSYGGTMRGGQTDSTLVVGDGPLLAPPIVEKLWAAVGLHHAFWEPVRRKLRPGAVVVVNASLFEGELDRSAQHVFEVPATSIASEVGNPMSASMVLVGALAGVTGLLSVDCLVEAMRESLPSYRRQHAEVNERALRAGSESVPSVVCPAWVVEEHAA
jgi:2-oxoacid:acceptor oxidoreductase gamma subunit (pyruvate/2-ketoisovalerate family)